MLPRQARHQLAAERFGRAVRDARARGGLSQAGLAERASLHQTTISRLESASLRGMRYETLLRVLAGLGMTSLRIEVERQGWVADLMSRLDLDRPT